MKKATKQYLMARAERYEAEAEAAKSPMLRAHFANLAKMDRDAIAELEKEAAKVG